MPDDDGERVDAVRHAFDDFLNRLASAVVDEILAPAAITPANSEQAMPPAEPSSAEPR